MNKDDVKKNIDEANDRQDQIIAKANRQPLHQDNERGKKTRALIGREQVLDASYYAEKYAEEGMKVFWTDQTSGETEKWVNHGAEPVPVEQERGKNAAFLKEVSGHKSKTEQKWVTRSAGRDGEGGYKRFYLLMLPVEEYQRLKAQPLAEIRAERRRLMERGVKDRDENTSGVNTYAPELPDGGVGLSIQTRRGEG